jgi:hypothetical protein
MNAIGSTIKLHLNQRRATFVTPLTITAAVAVLSVLITLVFWRAGSVPGSAGWIQGTQSNPGIVYALSGFLVYLGVASVGTTFPFALSLGATRRAFVAGTLIWDAILSAYVAVIFAVLNLIELATGHWFASFYIFDVYVLGAGDTVRLLLIVFLGVLSALTIGGVFAAAWVRFGSRGPQMVAVGLTAALIVVAIVVVPDIAQIASAFQLWWLAVLAGVVILLSSLGTWALLRSAIVR